MNRILKGLLLIAAIVLPTGTTFASDNFKFKVTITNITNGEIFTPIMVASHRHGVKLFKLGKPASTELEILAESGNTAPLTDSLLASGRVLDVVTADDVLPPGGSITLTVKSNERNSHVSVASMLVPTNDAFFAVNGIHVPDKRKIIQVLAPAYDAGTENNDELCVSIPGPPFICAGEGVSANGGEGYVYIHGGIQGNGDLAPASHDWRNPVARITIRRVKR